jgi:transposase
MEACTSDHYWARQLKELGHKVELIPPQHVKTYLRGNKNDYNDALAIAKAVIRPQMRFVEIKTEAQQDIQALHRLREQRIQERTAQCNQLRGLLAEYGLILPKVVPKVGCPFGWPCYVKLVINLYRLF